MNNKIIYLMYIEDLNLEIIIQIHTKINPMELLLTRMKIAKMISVILCPLPQL